jgi:4,5-DOPA dioxygenase extradiol
MPLALLANRAIIYLAILLVSLCIPLLYQTAITITTTVQGSPPITLNMSDTTITTPSSRMPVYFLSIGGPNFMENTQHPAYAKLVEVGKEITTKVKPKAIVVFSAHWQDSPDRIQINAAEDTDIIYDFYGFPAHYYEYQFPNKGSPELANKVIERLGGIGVEVQKVKRGLDHGVWAGFVVGIFASGLQLLKAFRD